MIDNIVYNVKRINVKSVLTALSRTKPVSRLDISKSTGLSLMTVGKVIDMLCERGVAVRFKEIKASSGRKAELVSFNPENFMAVIDISGKTPSAFIFNVNNELIDRFEFNCTGDVCGNDYFYSFFKKTGVYLTKKYSLRNFAGAGILISSRMNAGREAALTADIKNVKNAASELLGVGIDCVCDVSSAAVMYGSAKADRSNSIYIYIGSQIYGCAASGGCTVENIDFGKFILDGKNTLEASLSKLTSSPRFPEINEAADALSRAIYNAVVLLNAKKVFIELSEDFSVCTKELGASLERQLDNYRKIYDIPAAVINYGLPNFSQLGMSSMILDSWLDNASMI